MSPSPLRRRAARSTRFTITLAAIASLALTTPAAAPAQQAPAAPNATQVAPSNAAGPEREGIAQPPARTDTSLRAAPMPADAAPVPTGARARTVAPNEVSAQAWTKRPPANRAEVSPLRTKWAPTEEPKAKVAPGQMRSDREEIPEGFTKADADKAETMEATLASRGATTDMRAMAAPGCQVYWPAPYEVCGVIRDKYNALGGPNSFLLFPKTNELTNPDGIGRRTEFQNGPIYWSPQGGAHPVVNHFLAAWARHGYENSYLGYPTTDEIANPDGIGRRQHFEGSTIYWSPADLLNAYSVGGAIADKWHTLGAEQGHLGYPNSDEMILPDGVGRMNSFENGAIYWHPTTGAHEVRGTILLDWAYEGYEQGPAGYPVAAPELLNPNDTYWGSQQFQHEVLFGAMVASEPIVREYDGIGSMYLYDRVAACVNSPFTDDYLIDRYSVEGSTIPAELHCGSMRHIYQDHFKHHPLNPEELAHFTICAQNTLQAEVYTRARPGNWGMQRSNYLGEADSVVLMALENQNVVSAWSKKWGSPDNEKSREFKLCAVGLGLLYRHL